VDAALVDVGELPGAGQQEGGLLAGEQAGDVLGGDRALERPVALLAQCADPLERLGGLGLGEAEVLGVVVAVGGLAEQVAAGRGVDGYMW
jgi:hypothetical protein